MEVNQEVDIGDINIDVVKEEFGENVRVKQEPVVVQGVRVDVQNKVGHSREIKNTYQAMTRDEKRGWRIRKRSGDFDEADEVTRIREKEENLEDEGAVGGAGGGAGYATGGAVDGWSQCWGGCKRSPRGGD